MPNLVVYVGVQRSLDRLFNRNGPPGPIITVNPNANFLSSTNGDGTAGSSMTNVFTMDLTTFSSWGQTFQATVTGTGS